jgi:RNA polymerase sigma factor (sigma-70 family)
LALPNTTWEGTLVNSGQFDGMSAGEAVTAITEWLESIGGGAARTQYRLHDWCISRQRYWGPPIPIIYCDKCGTVPVPEEDLPVVLPETDDFRPDESGVSPLARLDSWYHVPCPKCGTTARRETDVSDTFLDSSWYFLRYPSTDYSDRAFDPELTKKWLPVSQYIGGNEHAVLHLMYSRFITMALHDLELLPFEEPYRSFKAHGTIVRDGAKMSKSRGNVVIPDEYIDRWGADTFRMYLMFLGPYQEGGDFRDEGIAGIRRFLDKVWTAVSAAPANAAPLAPTVQRKLHQTVGKVTDDTEGLRYNTAISALMEYLNTLRSEGGASAEALNPLLIMLAPFAPHMAEECWERLGHGESIFDATWPAYDRARGAGERTGPGTGHCHPGHHRGRRSSAGVGGRDRQEARRRQGDQEGDLRAGAADQHRGRVTGRFHCDPPRPSGIYTTDMTNAVIAAIDDIAIQRAKAGDINALERVYRAYEGTVYSLARRICRSPEDAEDALQEAFLEVCRSIGRFRGSGPGSLTAWIKRIAASKALMKIRREKYRDTDELFEDSAPASNPGDEGLRMDLETVMQRLSDTSRAVVWLHDVEGYTHEDIAELMGKSVSFSKSQLSRAHARLRKWLGEEAVC